MLSLAVTAALLLCGCTVKGRDIPDALSGLEVSSPNYNNVINENTHMTVSAKDDIVYYSWNDTFCIAQEFELL